MRVLVVYYSRSGHTRAAAAAIATACAADLEEIAEPRDRRGVLGYMRSAYQALSGDRPVIEPARQDPAAYDLVVLGAPVWASRMAAPMRSYITEQKTQLPEVVLFCTMGGSGGDKALSDMAALCGKTPVARLTLRAAELRETGFSAKIDTFVESFLMPSTGKRTRRAPRSAGRGVEHRQLKRGTVRTA